MVNDTADMTDFGAVMIKRNGGACSGGYLPSVVNAYRVAGALAHAIVADWPTWSAGPPE